MRSLLINLTTLVIFTTGAFANTSAAQLPPSAEAKKECEYEPYDVSSISTNPRELAKKVIVAIGKKKGAGAVNKITELFGIPIPEIEVSTYETCLIMNCEQHTQVSDLVKDSVAPAFTQCMLEEHNKAKDTFEKERKAFWIWLIALSPMNVLTLCMFIYMAHLLLRDRWWHHLLAFFGTLVVVFPLLRCCGEPTETLGAGLPGLMRWIFFLGTCVTLIVVADRVDSLWPWFSKRWPYKPDSLVVIMTCNIVLDDGNPCGATLEEDDEGFYCPECEGEE